MTWTTVRSIGEARALRNSAVLIVIVPIVAQLMLLLGEAIGVKNSPIRLPLTMLLSYCSALVATIGWISYERYCPSLLKRYQCYSDFKERASHHDLEEALVRLLVYKYKNRTMQDVEQQQRAKLEEVMKHSLISERRFQDESTIDSVVEVIKTVGVKPESTMILFDYLRSSYDKLFPILQRVTYGCFLGAAILLLTVVGINTYKVFEASL